MGLSNHYAKSFQSASGRLRRLRCGVGAVQNASRWRGAERGDAGSDARCPEIAGEASASTFSKEIARNISKILCPPSCARRKRRCSRCARDAMELDVVNLKAPMLPRAQPGFARGGLPCAGLSARVGISASASENMRLSVNMRARLPIGREPSTVVAARLSKAYGHRRIARCGSRVAPNAPEALRRKRCALSAATTSGHRAAADTDGGFIQLSKSSGLR